MGIGFNWQKVLGIEYPSTLGSYGQPSLVLRNQGKYEEAEQMHREVMGTGRRC